MTNDYDRKRAIKELANDLDRNRPDAWYHLLMYAVSDDPDIPDTVHQPTKSKLRARLIRMFNGAESIDPRQWEYRAEEKQDQDIYAAIMTHGGNITDAAEVAGKQFNMSGRTARNHYNRHIKRYPKCSRLDGRKKKNKR